MSTKSRVIAVLMGVLEVVASACTATTSGTSSGSLEVVAALTGEPGILDPHQRGNAIEFLVCEQLFDTLTKELPQGGVEPGLAESWQFASDGLAVTLKLRQGVKFHDGTPFNADAVKFNYERQLDESSPYYKQGHWTGIGVFNANFTLPVDVIDDYTVRLHMKTKVAPDITLAQLAATPAAIVSPTAVKAAGADFPKHVVGTGPYRFVSWEKGQRLVLERNDDYWGTKSEITRLVFVFIPDPDGRVAALKAGTADVNVDIGVQQIDAIKADNRFSVVSGPARHIWEVLLNLKSVPQFADKRVRMALNYAINKQAIVRDILRGGAVVAKGPMSPVFGDYYDDTLPGFPYDPSRAKNLLADAGFPNGTGLPNMTIKIPVDAPLAGDPLTMSQAIQSDLAAVGVTVTLQPSDVASWQAQLNKGDFQMAVWSLTPAYLDPDLSLYTNFHSSRVPPNAQNYGSWTNAEFDRLVEASRATSSHTERVQLVKRAEQIVAYEDPAAIWIEHAQLNVAFRTAKLRSFVIGTHPAILFFNLAKRA